MRYEEKIMDIFYIGYYLVEELELEHNLSLKKNFLSPYPLSEI